MLANIYMQLGQKDSVSLYINKVRAIMERFATSHFQSGILPLSSGQPSSNISSDR